MALRVWSVLLPAFAFCNFDNRSVGFPRDCGQSSSVSGRWISFLPKPAGGYYGGGNHGWSFTLVQVLPQNGLDNVVIVMDVIMPDRKFISSTTKASLLSMGPVGDDAYYGTDLAIYDNNLVFASGRTSTNTDDPQTDSDTVYIEIPIVDPRVDACLDGKSHEIALLLYTEGATIALFIDGIFVTADTALNFDYNSNPNSFKHKGCDPSDSQCTTSLFWAFGGYEMVSSMKTPFFNDTVPWSSAFGLDASGGSIKIWKLKKYEHRDSPGDIPFLMSWRDSHELAKTILLPVDEIINITAFTWINGDPIDVVWKDQNGVEMTNMGYEGPVQLWSRQINTTFDIIDIIGVNN